MDVDRCANLEIVANDLDDSTHLSIDEIILFTAGVPNEKRVSLLLHCIVAASTTIRSPSTIPPQVLYLQTIRSCETS